MDHYYLGLEDRELLLELDFGKKMPSISANVKKALIKK